MGGAIALGTINQGLVEAKDITISHLSQKMRPLFGSCLNDINQINCNKEAIEGSDFIVVAVKPWLVEEVLGEISQKIDRAAQSIISVVAGVSFEQLSKMLEFESKGTMPLYRVIPNTAISIGSGISVISSFNAPKDNQEAVTKIFKALGSAYIIKESMMSSFTSLASCGIAFALRYIDAAKRGGEAVGIPSDVSLNITIETMQGALDMLRENLSEPQSEIDKVTTKGGLTFKGLEAMEREGFSESVICAIKESR